MYKYLGKEEEKCQGLPAFEFKDKEKYDTVFALLFKLRNVLLLISLNCSRFK
jgi:hypothetical protein